MHDSVDVPLSSALLDTVVAFATSLEALRSERGCVSTLRPQVMELNESTKIYSPDDYMHLITLIVVGPLGLARSSEFVQRGVTPLLSVETIEHSKGCFRAMNKVTEIVALHFIALYAMIRYLLTHAELRSSAFLKFVRPLVTARIVPFLTSELRQQFVPAQVTYDALRDIEGVSALLAPPGSSHPNLQTIKKEMIRIGLRNLFVSTNCSAENCGALKSTRAEGGSPQPADAAPPRGVQSSRLSPPQPLAEQHREAGSVPSSATRNRGFLAVKRAANIIPTSQKHSTCFHASPRQASILGPCSMTVDACVSSLALPSPNNFTFASTHQEVFAASFATAERGAAGVARLLPPSNRFTNSLPYRVLAERSQSPDRTRS